MQRRTALDADPGLCSTCQHAKVVTSLGGSTFYLCRLSATDPAFPKYPTLPVIRCTGYLRRDSSDGASAHAFDDSP